MEQLKWRFPLSNFGSDKGLSTGDKEAFKETPYTTFAREILQNSLDASADDSKPVVVEINDFEIETNKIPGKDDLVDQIELCKQYWCKNSDTITYCNRMLETLNQEKIHCLRVSDFNTTGAKGASTMSTDEPFFAMTKGSGHSVKPGIKPSAGSKGMGKNAAYLMSYIDLIFYSTITKEDRGSLGVANFITGCSKDEPKEDKRDYTQGPGYYSPDDYHSASKELINFDNSYDRGSRIGTDLFILGFKNNENWEKEIINSSIASFMVAIFYECLEIKIGKYKINKENLQTIIDSDVITEKNKILLQAQLDLLKGNGKISIYDIETDYGTLKLLIKVYDENEKEKATHQCDIIRYPYMKIKSKKCATNYYPVSALCIIGDCVLSRKLLDIENPKHDNWEPNRYEDPDVRKEIRNLLNYIEEEIDKDIEKSLNIQEGKSVEPYGAEEYLSLIEEGKGAPGGEDKKEDDSSYTVVGKIKTNETITTKYGMDSSIGDAVQPDIGVVDEEGDGAVHPNGQNSGIGGEPRGNEKGTPKEGDNIILKKIDKTAISYKFISIGKGSGIYKVVFDAPIDYENCYLEIRMLDDRLQVYDKVKFKKVTYENKTVEFKDTIKEFGPFSIRKSKKVSITIEIEEKKYFGSEVVVICK